jgi:lauroyl/myristoyl acyltransferase
MTSASPEYELRRPSVRDKMAWRGRRRRRRAELERRFGLALEGTALAGSQRAVTRRHLEVSYASAALITRSLPLRRIEVSDPAVVRTAIARGNGVIIASVHSPTQWIGAAALPTALGDGVMWVALEESARYGVAAAARSSRSTFVPANGSYRQLRERLNGGGFVGLLVDVPGDITVSFLNKPAVVSSGFARLARWHEATIVPGLAVLDGRTLRVELADPIEATREMSRQSICHAVFAGINSLLLRHPYLWQPYTSDLWPADVIGYRWTDVG